MWRRTRRPDDDFRKEIEAHIALETDQLIADGLSPDAAAVKARHTVGNTTRIRERYFESQRVMWVEDLCQ
ncbi:MAG: permease prefix domain 1-containing protein, partial [Vicinamibacterales bacterium]